VSIFFIAFRHIYYTGLEERQREEHEQEYLEEMDEDEYDALPDDERQRIDDKRLQRKINRLRR
jgi:hypothetical protein